MPSGWRVGAAPARGCLGLLGVLLLFLPASVSLVLLKQHQLLAVVAWCNSFRRKTHSWSLWSYSLWGNPSKWAGWWGGDEQLSWECMGTPSPVLWSWHEALTKSSSGGSWDWSICKSTDLVAACCALVCLCTGYVGLAWQHQLPAGVGASLNHSSTCHPTAPPLCWRGVSREPAKGSPSPKINTKEREYLSARACYWKTDLSSYKQEKDIEAYLYFCPWAQRG